MTTYAIQEHGPCAVILAKAADLITSKGWTTRAYARNAGGDEEYFDSSDACQFCAFGAIRRAGVDLSLDNSLWLRASNFVKPDIPNDSGLTIWNDHDATSAEEVSALLLKAAARAAAEFAPA